MTTKLNYAKEVKNNYPKWGEIYWTYLDVKDNEQGGWRPVFIWSNDNNNKYSPNVNVYPLTSQLKALHLPVHVLINANEQNGLGCNSMAELEQPKTLHKKYLYDRIGMLSEQDKLNIMKAILIQFQMSNLVKIIDDEVISTNDEKEINVEVKFLEFSR